MITKPAQVICTWSAVPCSSAASDSFTEKLTNKERWMQLPVFYIHIFIKGCFNFIRKEIRNESIKPLQTQWSALIFQHDNPDPVRPRFWLAMSIGRNKTF